MKGNNNLNTIINNAYIDTYFQPIVSLKNGNIIGYEALSRGPKDSEYFLPNALISEAKANNRMQELDHILRKMALTNASRRDLRKLLFVNVDPLSIYEDTDIDRIIHRSSEYGIPPRRVIVEVSEKNVVCSFERFQKLIQEYKNSGFSVALDDINCAISDINGFSTISPDYIKIGGSLVKDIDVNKDYSKEKEITSIITIAKMVNAQVIAVGIETPGALKYLYHLGVDAVQGNFIGLPQKEIKGVIPKAKLVIDDLMNENE